MKTGERTCIDVLQYVRNSVDGNDVVPSSTNYELNGTLRSRRYTKSSVTGAQSLRRNAAHALLGKHNHGIDVQNCMLNIAMALIDKLGLEKFNNAELAEVFTFT